MSYMEEDPEDETRDEIEDEDEKARREWMEAEESCFWEEEPGDEDDPLPPFPPIFGGFPGGIPFGKQE